MVSRQENKRQRDLQLDEDKITAAQEFVAAYNGWKIAKELYGLMTDEENAAFIALKQARKRFKKLQSR